MNTKLDALSTHIRIVRVFFGTGTRFKAGDLARIAAATQQGRLFATGKGERSAAIRVDRLAEVTDILDYSASTLKAIFLENVDPLCDDKWPPYVMVARATPTGITRGMYVPSGTLNPVAWLEDAAAAYASA